MRIKNYKQTNSADSVESNHCCHTIVTYLIVRIFTNQFGYNVVRWLILASYYTSGYVYFYSPDECVKENLHIEHIPYEVLFPVNAFVNLVTLLIHKLLSRDVYWWRSCSAYSGLAYEIYSGSDPSTYIYYVVCYRVIAAYLK